jgi:uncharacterized repeat protein (TIGR03806 family)
LPVALEPAYPNIRFSVPVNVIRTPGAPGLAFVVEAAGTVSVLQDDVAAATADIFLDLSNRLQPGEGEMGLWDVTFHPRYPERPYLYAFYTGHGGSTGFRSVLSRFTAGDNGQPVDPTSEEILISIERSPGTFHAGGKIGFSPDGLLFVSTGDGDEFGDPSGRAQDPFSLLGKMLRIDVDAAEPYAIPFDNPFSDGSSGAPEVYALGFRNPWRWSFDREAGDLWLGDVGHLTFEEIDRVVLGGNYGWNVREAAHCFARTPCDDPLFVDPVVAYGRTQGTSVTGGYVYHGSHIPELAGHYVYADFSSGRIWALFEEGPRLLLESGLAISAFAEDHDGELLVMEVVQGTVLRLVPSESGIPGRPAPYFNITGCADDPLMVAYEVNAPLWSDGLDKERFILVPPGTTASVGPDGDWELPNGTVLTKTFSLAGRKIETRLLARGDDGSWAGWSYEWDAEQADASLVDEGRTRALGDRLWYFPSSAQCPQCHTAAAGHSLGLEQSQLDRGDQLKRLVHEGIAPGTSARVAPLSPLERSDAPLAWRARSYLHSNCSMCHRPGGPSQGGLDLRVGTPLSSTGVCDEPPSAGDFGLADARVVAPGAPERSVLLQRMAIRGEGQMPPLATLTVDQLALELISSWIGSLSSCEDQLPQ